MKHIHIDKIKSLEGPPKKVNIFSEKEIKMIKETYLKYKILLRIF